jgi:hypothetical protein
MYTNHKIKKCQITGDDKPISYFSLGDVPLVNNLANSEEESINCEKFPLNLNFYEKSGLSSLDCVVNPEKLFSTYLYKSSVNTPYIKHCKDMYSFISDYLKISSNTNIMDIGGNDGTLLESFQDCSSEKLDLTNVDPSKNLCLISENKGIKTYNAFFTFEFSKMISRKYDLITTTNVFQHTETIKSFALGVENILSDDGIWILEFPYWIHDMETNQFDQIYHEHIYYYSIKPLSILFESCGLRIINVTKQTIHGGTLRLLICKKSAKYRTDLTVDLFLNSESKYNKNYHLEWGNRVQRHLQESKSILQKINSDNKSIYGFGAAAKGCVYLNSIDVDKQIVHKIIDDTDIKQGKYLPGTGIKIYDRDILQTNNPDYILILTHNFADFIVESLKPIYSGKFIVLLPEIKIIN